MEESKSVSKGKRTQDFIAKHLIFTSHKLSAHSLTRLNLARMPSQGGGSTLKSISPTTRN
jgi:hypothetical protein